MTLARSRRLQVEITGDNRDFRQAVDGSERRLSRFGSRIGGFATGAAAAFAGAFAVRELAHFGTALFNQGAQLDVFATKVNTVFGDQAESVREWAEANDAAFGLTEQQLAGAAASMGDLLVPMGFTRQEAADMSTDMLGLAGALSAWTGGTRSAAEVADILSKALLGEREQLKELGVSISEADVQAQMAAMGMEGLTGEALQQGKALATQALLFQRTQDAQEAWSDGSMDAIKTQNELKAVFAELKEELAIRLFPVFLRVASFITDRVIPAFENLVSIFKTEGIGGVFAEIGNAIADAVPAVLEALWEWAQGVGDWFVDEAWPWITEKAKELGSALWEWITAEETWTALGRWLTGVGTWIVNVAWPWIVAKAKLWGSALWSWITDDAIPKLWEWAQGIGSWIVNDAWPWIKEKARELAPALWKWITETAIPATLRAVQNWGTRLWNWLKDDALPTIASNLASGASALWDWIRERGIPGAVQALQGWWRDFRSWLENTFFPGLSTFLSNKADALSDWIKEHGSDTVEKLSEWSRRIEKWFIFTFIPGLFVLGQTAGAQLVVSVVKGLVNGLPQVFMSGQRLGAEIVIAVLDATIGELYEAGKTMMSNLKDGLVWYAENSIMPWANGFANDLVTALLGPVAFAVSNLTGSAPPKQGGPTHAVPKSQTGFGSGRVPISDPTRPIDITLEIDGRVVAKSVETVSLERPLRVRLA